MDYYDTKTKKLAKKLSTITAEDLRNPGFRHQVLESSIEIRDLESKLRMAYILKERRRQVEEKEAIRIVEKELTAQEREETEQRLKLEEEVEAMKILYEKWKKERYCKELVEQAACYRMMQMNQLAEERELDEMHLQRILRAEIRRERREREERERKKQKLAQELRQCIRLQEQWRAIQRLIEAEEDRLIEECRAQQRRLSQMQQDERHRKAEQLAAIRQRLQRTLEMEERRRREREELWVEYGCEEKEEAEERKRLEEEKMARAQKAEWKRGMEEQLEEARQKRIAALQEAQYERLWMLEQAELNAELDRREAELRRKDRTRQADIEAADMEARRKRQEQEAEEKAEEQRREEARQEAEDRAIAEERRRILQEHAPLLVGFLPRGVFRNAEELDALPEDVRATFRRLLFQGDGSNGPVRIQDDPDLW